MTKKAKKYRLTMIFHNLEDLQEHVRISCDLGLNIKEADWLDLKLPAKNFSIKEYVLKKVPYQLGFEFRGANATSK